MLKYINSVCPQIMGTRLRVCMLKYINSVCPHGDGVYAKVH